MLIPTKLMHIALKEAKLAYEKDEVPVGCVIADNKGNIISQAHNLCRSLNDPTAHAEILAIQSACKKLKTTNLSDYQLFVTLEPCSMCAGAIGSSKISKLFFGLYDKKFGAIINGSQIFHNKHAYPPIEIFPEMLDNPSKEILNKFFAAKR